MTSIGLVLGGGGVVGGAFHVGTAMAIADVVGWDARHADLIVGTSAGASIAATLRSGLSPGDHFARTQDEPVSDAGRALVGETTGRFHMPEPPTFDPLSLLRPTAPWLVAPAFLAPGPVRPGLLSGLLPRGAVPTGSIGDRIRSFSSARWPERPTWICATRLRDGKRVVFGRDDVDADDLGLAVEASSAVPGFFTPVRVGHHQYIDGGNFSPTNADLVARLALDLVIVVSPMSAVASALGPSLSPARAHISRRLSARTLSREVAAIRKEGTPVLVIQPTAGDMEVMNGNPFDNDIAPVVSRIARESVRRYLERPDVSERVAILDLAAARTS